MDKLLLCTSKETNKASIDDRLCKSENDGQSFSQSSFSMERQWTFLKSRYGQLAVFYLEKALPLFIVTRGAMRREAKDI